MFIHQIYNLSQNSLDYDTCSCSKKGKVLYSREDDCLILDALMIQSSPSGVIPYLGETFGSLGSGPLPETNSNFAPEHGWLEYECFLLGLAIFRGELSVLGSMK